MNALLKEQRQLLDVLDITLGLIPRIIHNVNPNDKSEASSRRFPVVGILSARMGSALAPLKWN